MMQFLFLRFSPILLIMCWVVTILLESPSLLLYWRFHQNVHAAPGRRCPRTLSLASPLWWASRSWGNRGGGGAEETGDGGGRPSVVCGAGAACALGCCRVAILGCCVVRLQPFYQPPADDTHSAIHHFHIIMEVIYWCTLWLLQSWPCVKIIPYSWDSVFCPGEGLILGILLYP